MRSCQRLDSSCRARERNCGCIRSVGRVKPGARWSPAAWRKGARFQECTCRAAIPCLISGKRCVQPFRVKRRTVGPSRRASRRKPSNLISWIQRSPEGGALRADGRHGTTKPGGIRERNDMANENIEAGSGVESNPCRNDAQSQQQSAVAVRAAGEPRAIDEPRACRPGLASDADLEPGGGKAGSDWTINSAVGRGVPFHAYAGRGAGRRGCQLGRLSLVALRAVPLTSRWRSGTWRPALGC